jgi:hypothetical protein
MAIPVAMTSGHWWRFDRYILEDGYIKPHPEAVLTSYDPWAAFWESRQKGDKGGMSPYVSLASLVESLGGIHLLVDEITAKGKSLRRELDTRGTERLLAWCSSNGLLGLVFDEVRIARFAPRWSKSDNYFQDCISLSPQRVMNGSYMVSSKVFDPRNAALEWVRQEVAGGVTQAQAEGFPPGTHLAPEALREKHGPLVFLAKQHDKAYSVAEAWGRYFPDLPADDYYDYPLPEQGEEERFWRAYCEPLEDFIRTAIQVGGILTRCDEQKLHALGTHTPMAGGQFWSGIDALNALVASAHPVLDLSADGKFGVNWSAPSLRGNLAMMLVTDLAEGARARRCLACPSIYLSTAYQAKFCSSTCRFRKQKQDQRAKKKPAVQARSAGDDHTRSR